MNDNLKKSFLKIEYEFIGYFFGVMSGLAYFFILFDMVINENNQLLKANFPILLTIKIFCLGLGYGSLNKKMIIYDKPFKKSNIFRDIFNKVQNQFRKMIKNDSIFNLTNYVLAILIGIFLFFQMNPYMSAQKNISIHFTLIFYIFEASYFVFFTILILIEIKNFKKRKSY